MSSFILGIGADANGYHLKTALAQYLGSRYEIRDFGVAAADDALPYPSVAFTASEAVAEGEIGRAILICGTGIGMAISANKVPGVRAAVAYDSYSVERSVLSNNCQVLALGAQVIGVELAKAICDQWLELDFDTASRSASKLDVIEHYEASTARSAVGSDAAIAPAEGVR